MITLKPGTYKACPMDWGVSKTKTGTEQIFVNIAVSGINPDGQEDLVNITWFGFLTEKAKDRTIEAIYKMGFNGDFEGLALGHDSKALDVSKTIMVVTENEEYEGETNSKIKWINEIGEVHGIKRLDKAEALSIINKYKGDFQSKKPVGAKKALNLS